MALNLPSLNGQPSRACPKPPKREPKAKKPIRRTPKTAEQRDHIAKTRDYCFGRERNVCRICRLRVATSLHELRPRSLGGKVSKRNSIAVCGTGTTGCHGLIQQHRITYTASDSLGAEAALYFMPADQGARDWLKIGERHGIESPPMVVMESAE